MTGVCCICIGFLGVQSSHLSCPFSCVDIRMVVGTLCLFFPFFTKGISFSYCLGQHFVSFLSLTLSLSVVCYQFSFNF
uniref:Uncharacterized protein n=1 Tax=Rhizophora mucronata TaxID=61149 RepID=A0A2P2K6H8_RHIMU